MSGRMFTVSFRDVAGSASADADRTIAAVFTADTLGHRCRVREIALGFADDAPADLNLGVSLQRTSNVGAGTKTAFTAIPLDSLSLASIISGGVDYSVEPTTYGNPFWAMELHRQNSLLELWVPEDAPICGRNELVGLVVTARTAAAARMSGHIVFEEF